MSAITQNNSFHLSGHASISKYKDHAYPGIKQVRKGSVFLLMIPGNLGSDFKNKGREL